MKNMLPIYLARSGRSAPARVATIFALAALLAALPARTVLADEITDVSALMRANQYAEAGAKADAFLAKRPRDAQMRFLKGVILTEQNRAPEAITVFTRLTEDFPDLPEPYNNLAVLYAAGGQFEKARAALDRAIRTNPSYATAYENLGDIHAKLASQAYDKALQLDSGNATAKSKLTLVRSLVPDPAGSNNAKIAAAPAVPKSANAGPVTVMPAPVQPPAAASGPAKPAPMPPAVIAKVEPPKAQVRPEPKAAKPIPAANTERDAVLATVNGWAHAWSAKDVKSYLAYYGNDFETPGGMSRKAWIEERQARIAGKGRISVRVEAPQVSVDGNTAVVKFRQGYVSDRLSTSSRKTLVLNKQRGKWQIHQERTGS